MLILIFLTVFITSTVHAEPGFFYITDTVTDKQETYLEVVGEIEVDVLDEEGNPTGKKIKRPKTKEVTRNWKETTRTQGGTSIAWADFGSGFLGKDVKEMMENGYTEFLKDWMEVTYLSNDLDEEDRKIYKRVSVREWMVLGEPGYLEFNPKYHYSEIPTVNLNIAEFEDLIDP